MPSQILSKPKVEDSSDIETDSTNPTQTLKETVKKIRQNSISASVVDADSDEDSDASDAGSQASSSSSTSNTSSAGKRKADDVVTISAESVAKRVKTSGTSTKRIESSTYVPPQGYVASRIAAHDFNSRSKGIFEGLDGKQIWHISAPSSMPISKLESLDLQSALKGTPVLSRKGVQYILQQNTMEGQNLLLPKGTSGEYSASTCLPSQSFQIYESAQKPDDSQIEVEKDDDDFAALQFFATNTGDKKPPRKQPQNLHGRYIPYGVSVDDRASSHDIAMGNTAESDMPLQAALRTPKKSKKNRTENGDSAGKSERSSKSKAMDESPLVTDSHKKRRKDKNVSSSQ